LFRRYLPKLLSAVQYLALNAWASTVSLTSLAASVVPVVPAAPVLTAAPEDFRMAMAVTAAWAVSEAPEVSAHSEEVPVVLVAQEEMPDLPVAPGASVD
jgi:hypothetical protein